MQQEEIQRKLKQRVEAEKRNPLLKRDLGDLIDEMLSCHITGIYGTFYYKSLVEEINRRERYFKKHDINHDLIGKSLGAEGYK